MRPATLRLAIPISLLPGAWANDHVLTARPCGQRYFIVRVGVPHTLRRAWQEGSGEIRPGPLDIALDIIRKFRAGCQSSGSRSPHCKVDCKVGDRKCRLPPVAAPVRRPRQSLPQMSTPGPLPLPRSALPDGQPGLPASQIPGGFPTEDPAERYARRPGRLAGPRTTDVERKRSGASPSGTPDEVDHPLPGYPYGWLSAHASRRAT